MMSIEARKAHLVMPGDILEYTICDRRGSDTMTHKRSLNLGQDSPRIHANRLRELAAWIDQTLNEIGA